MRCSVFIKFKPNAIVLNKEEIKKLNDKEFHKQFEAGNISGEDFIEHIQKNEPPVFSQVKIAEDSI